MELTDVLVDIVQGMRIDDDLRQDLYVKLLEMEDDGRERTEQTLRALAQTQYKFLLWNRDTKESNRRTLEDENAETIQNMFNMNDYEPDPMDVLETEQEFERKLKLLSPLLEATLELVNKGYTSAEIAVHYGCSENTVYQRLWQAKAILEGE